MGIKRGVINGQNYLLLIDYEYIIYGNNASMEVTNNTKDITCRETDNWRKSLLTDREWSMEFEGKLGFTYPGGYLNPPGSGTNFPNGLQATNMEELINKAFMKQHPLMIHLLGQSSCPTAGSTPPFDPYWAGFGRLTSVSMTTPNEESSSVNLSIGGVKELHCVNLY